MLREVASVLPLFRPAVRRSSATRRRARAGEGGRAAPTKQHLVPHPRAAVHSTGRPSRAGRFPDSRLHRHSSGCPRRLGGRVARAGDFPGRLRVTHRRRPGGSTSCSGARTAGSAGRLRRQLAAAGGGPPPSANADQSRGAARPQRGQAHSVIGSACEPFRPGCACWPAQRVRSRIGPCPLGHSFGTSVSSFASAKSGTS
jgi:hypothetical protein